MPAKKKSPPKRGKIKLVSMSKSDRSNKKFKAVFLLPSGRQKTVHFGGKGNRDFTLINKKGSKWYLPTASERNEVRRRYIQRHSRGNENWNDPTTPGALSRWILWEKPTFQGSLRAYLKRFGITKSRA
jgi:hypothetical protein